MNTKKENKKLKEKIIELEYQLNKVNNQIERTQSEKERIIERLNCKIKHLEELYENTQEFKDQKEKERLSDIAENISLMKSEMFDKIVEGGNIPTEHQLDELFKSMHDYDYIIETHKDRIDKNARHKK